MLENTLERAKELGRMLGQTDEYKALQRAREKVSNDREMVETLNRLGELERELATALQSGKQPSEEAQTEYESLFGTMQSSSTYQGLVAAQSNFDKVLERVNQEITRGMEAGAQSRIILPS